jgi:putative membrane protein
MILNFSDHAANERTFLAWVRTALAIAGFGILIPKFDLLPGDLGLAGGFSLVAVASGMLILSAARFVSASREIDDTESFRAGGVRGEIILSGLLLLAIIVFSILLWVASRRVS